MMRENRRRQPEPGSQKKPSYSDGAKWVLKDMQGASYRNEEEAEEYERVAIEFFERSKLAEKVAETFNKNLPPELPIEEIVICDRAAGTGIITKALVDYGYKVRASDISETQLQKIVEEMPEVEIALEDMNGEIQNVPDSSVHGVVQVGATRFMTPEGQQKYVEEARRVLTEKGILIWPVIISEVGTGKLKQGLKHKAFSAEIVKLLEDNGFKLVEANTLVHGKLGSMTCTLLVAQKDDQFKGRDVVSRNVNLLSKRVNVEVL